MGHGGCGMARPSNKTFRLGEDGRLQPLPVPLDERGLECGLTDNELAVVETFTETGSFSETAQVLNMRPEDVKRLLERPAVLEGALRLLGGKMFELWASAIVAMKDVLADKSSQNNGNRVKLFMHLDERVNAGGRRTAANEAPEDELLDRMARAMPTLMKLQQAIEDHDAKRRAGPADGRGAEGTEAAAGAVRPARKPRAARSETPDPDA